MSIELCDAAPVDSSARYADRCARIVAALRDAPAGMPLGLTGSPTSNLFRDRHEGTKRRLDLSGFQHVLALDTVGGWADVEGCATYEQIVSALLPCGYMPQVVPQLKTITAGGAAAGVGIEATSFRAGLVHHTLLEFDVLTPAGEIVTCRPTGPHQDLFFGFANSYGTLGYALRLRMRVRRVKPCVHARHERFVDAKAFFEALVAACRDPGVDFLDGVVFDRSTFVLVSGVFADDAPGLSDYTYQRVYWRSLLERESDWLRTADWLWRWDTDWFWCSRNFGAQHPWVRRLWGRDRLNSRTYQRLMRWNARWGLTRTLKSLRGVSVESVIQDVDIPIDRAEAFLAFLLDEVGILPIWVCPLRSPIGWKAPLYPLAEGQLYVNFGFWDTVETRRKRPAGFCNRRIEAVTLELGGIKSLYSESYFSEDDFWSRYGGGAYAALKARYDPAGQALDLYRKCVKGG